MAQQAQRELDERFNELSDRDAFWGPLVGFRPEKRACIGVLRAFTMCSTLGGFYGMLLNIILALVCRRTGHQLPPLFLMPAVLTLTYYVAFQLTLGPAWNRRAKLLVRRADYLHSIGRREGSDQA
jgi:hypothetical protein